MKLLTAIILLISFGSLYSQGEYIESGQDAYGFSIAAGYHPKVFALGGSAAVSNSGTFDFGLSYTYLFLQEENLMDKSPSTVIAPFVGFHFLKQTDTNPFALSAQFQFNVHRITSKDESGQTSLGSWALGGSVFHRFVISNEFSFQPFVTGGMIKPERPTGEPSPGMSAFFDLSGAFIVQKKTRQMILKPSVSISNDETVYSLSFLFVDLI